MDDDREKGRFASWRTRIDQTLEFAERMVPVFEEAHYPEPTLRGYADWLNARNYKNQNGNVWRAETVSRMLAIDVRTRETINKVFDREVARLRYLRRDTADAERERAAYIARAKDLAERLRGPWEAVADRSKD